MLPEPLAEENRDFKELRRFPSLAAASVIPVLDEGINIDKIFKMFGEPGGGSGMGFKVSVEDSGQKPAANVGELVLIENGGRKVGSHGLAKNPLGLTGANPVIPRKMQAVLDQLSIHKGVSDLDREKRGGFLVSFDRRGEVRGFDRLSGDIVEGPGANRVLVLPPFLESVVQVDLLDKCLLEERFPSSLEMGPVRANPSNQASKSPVTGEAPVECPSNHESTALEGQAEGFPKVSGFGDNGLKGRPEAAVVGEKPGIVSHERRHDVPIKAVEEAGDATGPGASKERYGAGNEGQRKWVVRACSELGEGREQGGHLL